MHYDYVKALSDEVMAEGAEPVKCLFALDTGMGRIGFRVFTEEERDYAVEQYKKFLSSGCTQDPVSLLKIAGVDLTTREPIDSALAVFGEAIAEMEEISK